MIADKRVLAVVPARSGSKGVRDKNLRKVGGRSLIAQAARVLGSEECGWIDASLISTDSERYADEAKLHGLAAPFLRPAEISGDTATAAEVMRHAADQVEAINGSRFDIFLIVEPTSPLRIPADLRAVAEAVAAGADSALTVSKADTKFHPHKLFRLSGESGRLSFYSSEGEGVTRRQQLEPLYFRNGAAYAISRRLMIDGGKVVGPGAVGIVIDRPLPNIDSEEDIDFANWLIETGRAQIY